MKLVRIANSVIRDSIGSFFCRRGFGKRVKVFGVGRNKTGTTSLQAALHQLGYRVAPTRKGEMLLHAWAERDFVPVIELCKNYDAFQDIPFSLPGSAAALDAAFPHSKFILTVRDSADEWYRSLTKFHSKLFGHGQIPTWQDLESANYRWKGFAAECQRLVYEAEDHGLYNEKAYKKHYLQYNQSIRDYFADRREDFLELNVKSSDAFPKLCRFLGCESENSDFPWVNRT